MEKRKRKHIELFAGCGGMSLGLDAAQFELLFANELSPMAGETFAYNILNEDLKALSETRGLPQKVAWIRSQFSQDNLRERLRENPNNAWGGKYSDVKAFEDIKGKLLIGDINQLLELLVNNDDIVNAIRAAGIDLLSGGPPCQSFSLAGKRLKDDHKNSLPLSFAKIAGLIQPRVVLLENVKGITAPFTEDGEKYFAWIEVSKAFALENFVPVCMMLNSKYFGVAQNRPRFILFAFREDIFNRIHQVYPKNKILDNSKRFYQKVKSNKDQLDTVTESDFKYYDIESMPELFDGLILPAITNNKGRFISAVEAIGDLRRTNVNYTSSQPRSPYGQRLIEAFKKNYDDPGIEIKNHEPREHGFEVKARFRFYQVINEFQNGLRKSAVDLFTGKEVSAEYSVMLFKEFSRYNLYFKNSQGEYYKKPESIEEVQQLVKSIPTKKHSQRALFEFEPAPAQLTIPDDICHYHMEALRTMTVREMARFQSFPDWFEFRSKVTTGGGSRKFEVPQYTQVGNAVPPLLAKVLGETINRLLNLCN